MSTSVTLSIGTNTAIAAAKGFGWFVAGSPSRPFDTLDSNALGEALKARLPATGKTIDEVYWKFPRTTAPAGVASGQ